MCYDVAYLTKKAEMYAARYGSGEMWEEIQQRLPPVYHTNAFDEPDIPVITNEAPYKVRALHWSFIPMAYANKPGGGIYTTQNARNDNVFTSKMYSDSAESRRCLVMLDGFYDHHKKDKVNYPHYIQLKSRKPFLVGGLWQTFENKKDDVAVDTVTLITCPANKEMAWVHNEPAYSANSRMVFIVPEGEEDRWLHGSTEEAEKMIRPLPDDAMDYYACEPIKANKGLNRAYLGNVPEIQGPRHYDELHGAQEVQGSLF